MTAPGQTPRILLAAMGGTIAVAARDDGLSDWGRDAHDLLEVVASPALSVEVETRDICRLRSSAVGPSEMSAAAHVISDAIRSGCSGVVVTHGTDTIEETSYALALQLRREVPIVLTGAMRALSEPGSDGVANLQAALAVAITPLAADLGPVVVMQNEIHLARFVTKAHTARIAPLLSAVGPVGWIAENRVHIATKPVADDFLGMPDQLNAHVELITVAAGNGGALVDAAASIAQGIVIAGTGAGHVPPGMLEAIQRALSRGIPVVLASRTGTGPVFERTYGGPGSESDLLNRGLISAGTLSPLKARLRLIVALELGLRPATVFPA